ncbi:MAG: VTT domain-containing protein [Phycisphaerales bacterium]|nr:VTT domain-containing protein [Phycisphaerales bacterium]
MNSNSQPPAAPATGTEPDADFVALFRRLGPAGVLAVLSAAGPFLGGFVLLWYKTPIGEWLTSAGEPWGWAAFVAFFTLTAGLALLPTWSQAALAGAVFPFNAALGAIMLGVFLASTLGYVVARRVTGERAMAIIREHPRWLAVHQALVGGSAWKTFGIVTLVRFPPNSPFALSNLVLAATRVPWHIYIAATVVGMAPRSAFVCYSAAALGGVENRAVFWAGIAVTVAVLLVIGMIGNRALNRLTRTEPAPAIVTPPAHERH